MAAAVPLPRTITLDAVLDEMDRVAKDFGYPVDLAISLIEWRLRAKFEADDNVLEFQPMRGFSPNESKPQDS